MRPRAILFDLDDTIIDHSGNMEASWERVTERAAELVPGLDRAELRQAISEAADAYWSVNHREGRLNLRAARRRVVGDAFAALGLDREQGEELGEVFHELRESGYSLLPGALEALDRLREEGVTLALITNGETLLQRGKLERFDLARHFDHIQIEEEFGHGKPDELVYRHALETLGVRADETWMVGDNLEWEIAAPQKLGIYSIWVDRHGRGLPEGSEIRPDRVVSSIAELVWERKPDLSSDGLEPLLMRVFGTRPDSIERVATGVSAVVFRVGHQGTAFYVRLAEEEGEDLAMDAAVMKELRERGVKVAEVIHVEAFVPSVRRSVMITAEVPGRPVSEVGPDDLKTVVREAGRDLAILNQSPISGFGWVRRDCSRWPPVGELAEYGGFVTSGLPDSWPGPFANLFDAPTIDLLGALVAEEAIRELHEPTFAHGDFDLTHIFCLNGTYTGLIDFGDMLGAEPTFDLGTFLWANPRSTDDGLFDALVDGYRSGAPVPGSIEDITRSAILHGLRLLARWTGPGYKLQRPAQPTAQRVARLLERL